MNKTNRISILKRAFVRLNQIKNEYDRIAHKSATRRRLATAERLLFEIEQGVSDVGMFQYESKEYAISLENEILKTRLRFAQELAERNI